LCFSQEKSTINTRQIDIFVEEMTKDTVYLSVCYYLLKIFMANIRPTFIAGFYLCKKLATTGVNQLICLYINVL